MRTPFAPSAALTALTLLAGPAAAQSLGLDVAGGSFPGTILLDTSPGSPFVQAAVIIPSVVHQTTSLFPFDPRTLDIGLELLSAAPTGLFAANGHFTPSPWPVPALPSLLDQALYFQSLSVPGPGGRIVDQISPPRAIRFAPANRFRDRGTVLTLPRAFFPVITLADGRSFAIGGGSGALLAQVAVKETEVYDPFADSFTRGPDMTADRSLHTITRLLDGRYLIVAGVDRNNDPQTSCEIYDPATHAFTAAASLALQRMGHTATLLPDGRVLVAGGLTDLNGGGIAPISSTTRTTEVYDPVLNRWTPGPTMREERAAHTAVLLPNGRVLMMGGVGFFTIIIAIPTIESTTEVIDVGGSATAGPTMNSPRAAAAIAQISPTRWLLSGGLSSISVAQPGAPTASAEIYDSSTNAFTPTGSMAAARGLHSIHELQPGRWLAVGGADGSVTAPNALASTELYDVATGQWSNGPAMTSPRAAAGVYHGRHGQLHVLGGSVNSAGTVVTTTEWYYP
jgi:hypothetical protein